MDVLFLILGLLAAGMYKKDYTTLFMAGIGFIFYGLMTINTSIIGQPYSIQYGVLAIAYGVYLCLRASVDLISYKKKEIPND